MTRGTGLMSHRVRRLRPGQGRPARSPQRVLGVRRTTVKPCPMRCGSWKTAAACSSSPGTSCTKAWIIGIHSRDNDLVVNRIKGKQLTNVRASGTDEAVRLTTADQTAPNPRWSSSTTTTCRDPPPKSIRIRRSAICRTRAQARQSRGGVMQNRPAPGFFMAARVESALHPVEIGSSPRLSVPRSPDYFPLLRAACAAA